MSIKESALTAIQSIADADFIRAVTSLGASRRVLVSDLGKYMMEDYAGSELNGTEQSVQDAITEAHEDIQAQQESFEDKLQRAMITNNASGNIASFSDGSNLFPAKSLTVDINPIQSGSGTPSPDNVRPISGWASVDATICGINLWDEEWESGDISTSTGNNSADGNKIRSKNYCPIRGDMVYYVSTPYASTVIYFYDANKTYLSYENKRNTTMTTPQNAAFFKIRVGASSTPVTTYGNDISINYPSTDTSYHAYDSASDTYTTSLGTTVYGGTLDLVSGELTVTKVSVDMGGLSWQSYSSPPHTRFGTTGIQSTVKKPESDGVNADIISDRYTVDTSTHIYDHVADYTIGVGSNGVLYVYDTSYATPNDFKTAMNGVYLVYKLATPTTTTLTGQQVATLLGQNNVWADCGDTSVTYKADTRMYIDGLVGTTEDDYTANESIADGTVFTIGDNVYKATTAIASGETIAVGTNCVQTSIAEQINALYALV